MHTKGPYGQYLILRRICSLDTDFELNAKKSHGLLPQKRIPISISQKHYHRARKFNQDQLLDTIPRQSSEVPVMVTQFNPKNPQIVSLIKSNWNIIQNTDELIKIFKDKPIIGYRRLPNLRDILTNSSITYPPALKPPGSSSQHVPVCTRLGRCTYCPKLKKTISYH